MSDPAAVARAYFAAVTAKDPVAFRAVFADDAEMITPEGVTRGPDEICALYERAFFPRDLQPRPGPFVQQGEQLAVEIELMLDGRRTTVADFFTIEDGLITRLAIYEGEGWDG